MRNPTENWIDRTCIICSKKFKVMPWRTRKNNGASYCSISCLPQNQKGTKGRSQEKEKNANWKGGISKNRYRYKLIEKQRYPEKIKARDAVQKAKKSGKLIVGPCSVCQATEKIHAHHEDYSKPLDVIWLCNKCHHNRHN